eukprot:1141949-Pelagomonas_calceolata.AAC.4
MPECLVLIAGSLLMVAFHQRASGMSSAQSVSQVGSFSFRRILAAAFLTAITCRLSRSGGGA